MEASHADFLRLSAISTLQCKLCASISKFNYRILRNKRPPPNKLPSSLFEIANYKELKEKSEVL